MKIVILAAGVGSRLGESHLPKPLTSLANGESILSFQLKMISSFLSLDQVIVVVGYLKEKIMDRFPDLLYVYNPSYEAENTSKSLLRALKKIDEDVLWMNGDVVFHHTVLEKLLAYDKTCMLVNETKVGEEEVKYHADKNGKILQVSKQVANPQGEALGLNIFKAKDLPNLKKNLIACSNRDYFEKGIELCIQEGTIVWSLPVDKHLCTEIDFLEDLNRANQLIINDWHISQ